MTPQIGDAPDATVIMKWKDVMLLETIYGKDSAFHRFLELVADFNVNCAADWDQSTKILGVEECPTKEHWTEEQCECEDHFHRTVSKGEDGKIIVRLPLEKNCPRLGELKSTSSLEARMNKDPNL
ncbi:unnamed protein product, partial [Allacma fusca]